jgi:magnesium transporter
MPWLMVGLAGGFLAGGVASAFEVSLRREVALAFFLPLVVYMADAVGTQTETVLVRRLAYGEVPLWTQLAGETLIGLSIGTIVAAVAAGGLWFWGSHATLAVVVGASLGVTAVVATIIASILPLGLARLGADPALASGPVATVVQDILSVGIYLMIATILLPE